MPKIFLTGSAHLRGHTTGSGFLSNPARVKLRAADNRTGKYPTLHRMNRKNTSGILSNTQFNDTRTVIYGNQIKDDFTIDNISFSEKIVDPNFWLAAPGVIIKKEFDPRADLELTTGAVVLAGEGDTHGRWLRTKNKIYNPTLTFSLLQGPYNNTGALSRFKLNLGQGAKTDVFKIQISKDGNNWEDVLIKNRHIASTNYNIVDEVNNQIVPAQQFDIRKVLFGIGSNPVAKQIKPVLRFKLDMQDFAKSIFKTSQIKEPFYLRFIQPSVSDNTISVWAIGDVKIISRDNPKILYPLLDDGSPASNFFKTAGIATPNFINDADALMATGSVIRGIHDIGDMPFVEQRHAPFNEDSVLNQNNSGFFEVGVSESVLPGFNRPLTSKTVYEYRMKPTDSDVLSLGLGRQGGNTAITVVGGAGEGPDRRPAGQILLCYWNSDLNRWQEIGLPLGDNRGNHGNSTNATNALEHTITASCAGFGPLIDLTNGAQGSLKLKQRKAFEHAFLPISTYGFPFSGKYHATSSQHITAESLGITKPFLLEKITLDFKAEFAVPGHPTNSGNSKDVFATKIVTQNNPAGSPLINRRLKVITPTFFILRQFNKKNDASTHNFAVKTPGVLGATAGSLRVFEEIPRLTAEPRSRAVRLVSGSVKRTEVYDSREMISFGQYNLFVTASTSNVPDYLVDSGISMDDILNSGIVRDGFTVKKIDDGEVDEVFKVTSRMEFPARLAGKHEDVLSIKVHNSHPASTYNSVSFVNLENRCASRDLYLDGGSRSVVNGVAGKKLDGSSFLLSSSLGRVEEIAAFENLTFDSPYLIFPEDKLIFGWQYPMPADARDPKNSPGTTANIMKIEDCSLKMFGSQVLNNVETHEGLNQNLTSNAIHEVIGNDKITDTFDVATRSEYSGSMQDGFTWSASGASNAPHPGSVYYFGNIIFIKESSLFGLHGISIPAQNGYVAGNSPTLRVRENIFPDLGGIIYAAPVNKKHSVIQPDSALVNTFSGKRGIVPQISRFARLQDTNRIYRDALITSLNTVSASIDNRSRSESYGSLQSDVPENVIGGRSMNFVSTYGSVLASGNPKYYFSNKSYGQYSDILRQGLDGRFLNDFLSLRNRGTRIIESAVKVKFVDDEFDGENLNFRKFRLIKPNNVNNTAYESFQSSNISLFATSSVPFKEGKRESGGVTMNDDDVPSNRKYSIFAVEVT